MCIYVSLWEEQWRVHGRVDGRIPEGKLAEFEQARPRTHIYIYI